MYITIKEILNKDRNYNDKINSNEEGLDFLENESYYNRKFPRNNIDSSQDCLKQKDSNTVNIEKKFNFIIGDSGAGKTITALAIGELLDIRKWKIDIEGCKNKKIAYIFQEPKSFLDSCFTISDQFVEIGISEDKIKERLKEVNLSEGIERRYPHQISGGERQRVMIALAIASGDIDLLIADEPTSSLDFENQKIILDILKKLSADKRIKHILFITHDRLLVSNFIKDNDNDCKCFKFKKNKEINEINIEDLIEETRLIINPKNIKDSSSNVQDKNHYNDSNLILQNQNICITHKKTNRRILTNLSIEICKKQVIGIVGTSGCGKTTLINYLIGIINPKEWDISSDKKRNNQLKQQAIFQDSDQAFNPNTNIKEIFYETYQLFINEDDDNFDNWIYNQLHFCNILKKGMDLNEVIYKYPSQFSGGEKQRLALIRVLAAKPDIIFADEPFSRLDMKNKFEMINLMKRAQENSNLSYLIASHDLQTASIFCDKIIILKRIKEGEGAKQVNTAIKEIKNDENHETKWQLDIQDSNDSYSENILFQLNQILKIDSSGSKFQHNKSKDHNNNSLKEKHKGGSAENKIFRYYNILKLGHSSDVTCVECSNDGFFLATAEEDGIIIIWDTQTDKIISVLGGENGHIGKINSLKFVNDKQTPLLISSGEDGVRLWDINGDWKFKKHLYEGRNIKSVDCFQNENKLAICYEKHLIIFHINDNYKEELDHQLPYPINKIDISKDNKYVLCGLDGGICIYDINKKDHMKIQTTRDNYYAVKYSPNDSNIFVIARSNEKIKLFKQDNNLSLKDDKKLIFKQDKDLNLKDKINSISISSEGKYLVAGCSKKISVIPINKKLKEKNNKNNYEKVNSVIFFPNSDKLIAIGFSKNIEKYDIYYNEKKGSLQGHDNSIKNILIIKETVNYYNVYIGYNKMITEWKMTLNNDWNYVDNNKRYKDSKIIDNNLLFNDIIEKKKYCHIENKKNGEKNHIQEEVMSLANINEKTIAISTANHVKLFEKRNEIHSDEKAIKSLIFNEDKQILIGFNEKNEIILWAYNEKLYHINSFPFPNTITTIKSYKNYIIIGCLENIITVKEIIEKSDGYSLKKIKELEAHKGKINAICCSPCGNYIISGSNDQTVRVWNLDNGKCINTISLIGFINTIRFLPDSKDEFFAAGSRGCIYRCNIHKPEPISVTYLLDHIQGQCFLTVNSDGDLIKADDIGKSLYIK